MMPWLRFAGVLLLALACLTGGPGCSLIFARGGPKRPAPQQPVRCTRTYTAPLLDGLIAALFVTGVFYVAANPEGDSHSAYTQTSGVAYGIGLAGLFTISMAVGIARVGRCHELLDARVRAQAAQQEEEDEDDDEDDEDATEGAKAAGEATPASPPPPEAPTVTPQEAPNP